MSPFETLGLDHGADAAQVKRAYAKLLRRHRPDEDPAGFQRLHEAYEACLEQVRWREQGWDDGYENDDDGNGEDVAGEPAQAGEDDSALFAPFDAGALPTDAIETTDAIEIADGGNGIEATDGFDAGAFAEELVGRMRGDTRQAVEAWLQAHDDLYSLDRKRALQATVVHALETIEPATAARHFEAVTRFFGLDSIAGVDGWLQHRLYEIQRRSGDTAEFERILRAQTGPHATWADKALSRELMQPFQWLRRILIIACPGLPGRIGALARALHAADPESASSRLDRKARDFWERATDRNALHRERFAFMATRLALWSAFVSAFTATGKGGRGLMLDWATGFGAFFALWLVYALVVLGLIRFRDFNQSRMQWDMFLLIIAGGLGCGIVSVATGGSGAIPFIMTTIFWLSGRNDGKEGGSASQGAALAAGVTGFGLVLLILYELAGDAIAVRYLACAAALYVFASQAVHDLLFARARGIALPRARVQTGWMWRVFQVQAALLVVSMAVLATIRGQTGA